MCVDRDYDEAKSEWVWAREAPPSQKAPGGGDAVKKLKKKVCVSAPPCRVAWSMSNAAPLPQQAVLALPSLQYITSIVHAPCRTGVLPL